MDILVVGAGAMGTWVARTIDEPVAFLDRDPSVAADAAAATGCRVVEPTTEEQFELVCLAVPIGALEDGAREYADCASEAIVDVTGVMERAVTVLEAAAPELERASYHPLFAPENAPGRIAVVPDAPGPTTDQLQERFAAAGNEPFETTAGEHDRAMETVQAAAHAAILAYGIASENVPSDFQTPVSETLESLLGQVSGGTPSVYADIQAAFAGADRLAEAAESIAAADRDAFFELYDRAGRRQESDAWEGTRSETDELR